MAPRLLPASLRDYDRGWLRPDLIAGVTLAAIAIPEVMGYTSISETPLVTGLYTIVFPTLVFALLGASRLLVVGADSATAAILAAGLLATGLASPGSAEWTALAGLVALVTGGLLVIASIARLGFLGDFLAASVLIGFLTGVGIQVASGQIPDMLGVKSGSGNWFEKQLDWIKEIPDLSWTTFAYAVATLVIVFGFKRFLPGVPGSVIAVVGSIIVSAVTHADQHGVTTVGAVPGGFPPLGLPSGLAWSDVGKVLAVSFSCFVLIVAQSAATSRSFAQKHNERVDINRDLVGLSGASFAAGLSGAFVVNGSPTKTQILDEQKGRSQIANMTMSAVTLIVLLFATKALGPMPKSVLAAIVFIIGIDLIDVAGLRRIGSRRRSELVIALICAVVVFAVGVEQGIILAIVLSLLEIIRRQYTPKSFVVSLAPDGEPVYTSAKPGLQSVPGLIVFRYDADLFFANANRFVDDVEALVTNAPEPVRWLVIDAGALDDVDYTAGEAIGTLLDFLNEHHVTLALARADSSLLATLGRYGLLDRLDQQRLYGNLVDAVDAYLAEQRTGGHGTPGAAGSSGTTPG